MGDLVLSVPWVGGRDRWRWLLSEAGSETPLADFEVALDPGDVEYAGFVDLYRWLRWNAEPDRRMASEGELTARVGAWVGSRVLGERVGRAMVEFAPVTVRVDLPAELAFLAYRPLELAQVGGVPLARQDVGLVYRLPAEDGGVAVGSRAGKRPVGESLRVLAVFSLPTDKTVLGLRRERYELLRLVRRLGARAGRAIECEVLQYGVSRQRLAERAEDGAGWDVLHLSGHGLAGGLLLEKPDGSSDLVESDELVRLLRPARSRLKLAVVSACESGAASAAETLRWLRLDQRAEELEEQAQQEAGPAGTAGGAGTTGGAGTATGTGTAGSAGTASGTATASEAGTVTAAGAAGGTGTAGGTGGAGKGGVTVAGVARELAGALDCAVVAMRYPVVDDFAVSLADRLYGLLWESGQPVDAAVRMAVADVAGPAPSAAAPAISLATPAVFGARAVGLRLQPPRAAGTKMDPGAQPMAWFPDEPLRFVGRTGPMAKATAALAPESGRTAVLLHGMAGAGKTACAVELAYRHETAFTALAFWQAPTRGEEWPTALTDLAQRLESQLRHHGFTMVDKIGTLAELQAFLPRLTRVLERSGLLLVLDNLETLLDERGDWRDPRWTALIAALTGHSGQSRVVLTARVVPAGLDPARVQVLPVHALSLAEAVLLARELPNLRGLLGVDATGPLRSPGQLAADRDLVRRVLRTVQGHPKLLELADAAAADPDQLDTRLAAAEHAADDRGRPLGAFFDHGDTALDPDGFLDVLTTWTTTTVAALPAASRLLLQTLCCCEEPDRTSDVLGDNWADLWHRLNQPGQPPGIPDTLAPLTAAALLHPEAASTDDTDPADAPVRYQIHPGVAEAVRAHTEPDVQAAVDTELAAYWATVQRAAIEREGGEAGQLVVHAGLAAAPYLLRRGDWRTASRLLEEALYRDGSPATICAVIPLLRRIAQATGDPIDEGLLGQALRLVDPDEAEQHLRNALDTALAHDNYRTASAVTDNLLNLLNYTGRLQDALNLADQRADYTRRAGLGPWTQLLGEGQQAQILRLMGHAEQALTEAQKLRARMTTLPDQPAPNDPVEPWKIREKILSIGRDATINLQRWQLALDLNAEIRASQEQRNAGPRELAYTWFNDYGPLLCLGRIDEVNQLLLWCQQVFDDAGDTTGLGAVFSARAVLEDELGHPDRAVDLVRLALRYTYARPDPVAAAVGHHNLANYLARTSGNPADQLAHRLAVTLLDARTTGLTSKQLAALARDLRTLNPAAVPTSFTQLQARVEQVEGVRFGRLWAALAPEPDSGDDTLTRVLHAARDLPADQA